MYEKILRIEFKSLKIASDKFDVLNNIIDINPGSLILVNGYGIETEAPILWAWFKVINQEKLILGISNSIQSNENEYALNQISDCIIKSGCNINDTEKNILNIYN
jgi:hypothetical protein